MKFLAGFEADRFARSDADFSTGSGIAAYPGLSWPYVEDAKTSQLNAFTSGEGLFHALKDGVHRRLRFDARQASPLDYPLDEVLLDQGRFTFPLKCTGKCCC